MAVNPAIAHRLLQLLAEMGHAESQADVAFHLALGIEPVAPNPRDQLFRWVGWRCGGNVSCSGPVVVGSQAGAALHHLTLGVEPVALTAMCAAFVGGVLWMERQRSSW